MKRICSRIESISAELGMFAFIVGILVGIIGLLIEAHSPLIPLFPITLSACAFFLAVSFTSFRLQTYPLSEQSVQWLEAALASLFCVTVGLVIYISAAFIWNILSANPTPFVDLISQWDAGWYRGIVKHGYNEQPKQTGQVAGQANWAFFPLYPLLVWCVTTISGVSIQLAGTLVSVTALLIGGTFAYRYLVLTRSRRVACLGTGLLAFGPFSFYNYTLHTEALFICLIAIGFWSLVTDRYVIATVAGGLLSATRGLGVLFGVAIALHLAIHTDAFDPLYANWPFSSTREVWDALIQIITDRRVLLLAIVPVGLFVYMLFLWWLVGNPLAFITIQSEWGRSLGNPIVRLVRAVLFPSLQSQYLAAVGILGLTAAADLVRRGHLVEGVFALLLLLVPIASGLNSIPRYAFGTTVLVFAAGDWIARTRPLHTAVFGLLTALNVVLLMLWYSRHPIVS
jgi:hypothetical protein